MSDKPVPTDGMIPGLKTGDLQRLCDSLKPSETIAHRSSYELVSTHRLEIPFNLRRRLGVITNIGS